MNGMDRNRRFPWTPLYALTLIICATISSLTGCGSGGSSPSNATPTPTMTPTATPTPPAGISPVTARIFGAEGVTAVRDDSAARVQIIWQASPTIPLSNVLEYHIYRDAQIIGVASRSNFLFVDDASVPAGTSVNYAVPDSSGSGLSNRESLVPALTVGVTHSYQITVVYQIPDSGGANGGGNGGGGGAATNTAYRETTLSAVSGPTTPLARPGVIGPTGTTNLQNFPVTFQTVRGGDAYIFEFSAAADFSSKIALGPLPATYKDAATVSAAFDLSASFPNATFPAGTPIYCRVGVRASGDALTPLPNQTPNGGDYIYSSVAPFVKN